MHKSGFVNIIGRPNVGKSTLMNALVGERMSIITAKPQTTRHRIIGILSGDDFQVVFSDTPGIIQKPAYKMQEALNRFAFSTFEDADLMLYVAAANETYTDDEPLLGQLSKLEQPKFLILNKIDLSTQIQVKQMLEWWNARVHFDESFAVSALHQATLPGLMEKILQYLPEGPEYYPKDQLTDRPERFFVAEIIREKILEQYYQEVPYSVEVTVEAFKESKTKDGSLLVNISALIFVARQSQKAIILGKGGSAIKQLGTSARQALENWLEKKVFLELHVKIKENWRDDERMLRAFGYD